MNHGLQFLLTPADHAAVAAAAYSLTSANDIASLCVMPYCYQFVITAEDFFSAGTLPPTFTSHMPTLQSLSLSGNNINGTLPAEWGQPGNLPRLIALDISSNPISGVLLRSWASPVTWPVSSAPVACDDLQAPSSRRTSHSDQTLIR